jgi:hypothetical protein
MRFQDGDVVWVHKIVPEGVCTSYPQLGVLTGVASRSCHVALIHPGALSYQNENNLAYNRSGWWVGIEDISLVREWTDEVYRLVTVWRLENG